jgi:deazaflavin-dependent oxidoreductase (nitroreductase family)
VTNRITRPFAARLGGFAVIHHRGRKSGANYETPFNAWRHDDWIVVALTYGDTVDWLKNARAADESAIVMKGRTIRVGQPVDVSAEDGMLLVPSMVRRVLRLIRVDQFVNFPVISQTS